MRTITATEASRHFSDLLDAVERGETVTIMRGSPQPRTTAACWPTSAGPVIPAARTT